MGTNFTTATLNAIKEPFEIVNERANINYRGELDGKILWASANSHFARLLNADGTPCQSAASITSLKNTFQLEQRTPGRNKEGRIHMDLNYFNNAGDYCNGRGISDSDRQAIIACFRNGGLLYFCVAKDERHDVGLDLYVNLRCET